MHSTSVCHHFFQFTHISAQVKKCTHNVLTHNVEGCNTKQGFEDVIYKALALCKVYFQIFLVMVMPPKKNFHAKFAVDFKRLKTTAPGIRITQVENR